MSTTAQINANQLNAQKSTGPVTDTGRQNSAQNACKHGFTGQTTFGGQEVRQTFLS